MTDLSSQKCVPCENWRKPFTKDEYKSFLEKVKGWEVVDEIKIIKKFKFTDFTEALAFVNIVGELAEQEGHHPNINLYGWNNVKITLSTHNIKGLSENDFIMAAKIDQIEL